MHQSIALLQALLVQNALGHMQMKIPYPLRSPLNPKHVWPYPPEYIDYSNTNPLTLDGLNFPCKGYQNDPKEYRDIEAEYKAGGRYEMSIDGSAYHKGGECQLSLSGDNGKIFKVIKSMQGGCVNDTKTSWEFTIRE